MYVVAVDNKLSRSVARVVNDFDNLHRQLLYRSETRRSNQFTGVVTPDNLVYTWLWIVIQVVESVVTSSIISNVSWLRMTELFLQNTVYLRVAFLSTDFLIEWRKLQTVLLIHDVIHVSYCRKLQFPCQTQSCADHLYCRMVATHSRLTAFAKPLETIHGLYNNVVVTYLQRIEIFVSFFYTPWSIQVEIR